MDKTLLLDSRPELAKRDRGGMLSILGRFDQQLSEALTVAGALSIPSGRPVSKIILLGLGGSAIGGDLVRAYLGSDLGVPFIVSRGYSVPGWVDENTLAVVSSYSGNTEETLSAMESAVETGAFCVTMTSGGELERIARRDDLPLVPFPEGQPPRTALPFSFVGLLAVLEALGFVEGRLADVEASLEWVSGRMQVLGPDNPSHENPAKSLALQLYGRIPVVYGSQERLSLVARRWAAQFSENAKVLAYSSELPEMNHNEIVGWEHPADGLEWLVPVFLRDQDDHPRLQIRIEITGEILRGRVDPVLECWSSGETWLERLWALILLGDHASLYLALLNREDPAPVEVIESLKARLKQY